MKRHLVLLDGSKASERALPHAVAAARCDGAEIHLLEVLDAATSASEEAVDSVAWRMRRAEANAYLKAWKSRLEEAGVNVSVELRDGRATEQILDVARSRDVDLVVLAVGGDGDGLDCGSALGDVAQRVVAAGDASFLLVRGPPRARGNDHGSEPASGIGPELRYARILVPLDASTRAECALSVATLLARAHGATILLAHVAPVPEMPGSMPLTSDDVRLRDRVVARNRERGLEYVDALRARLAAPDLAVETRVLVAPDVARTVARCARDEGVDLVVLAAHGGGAGADDALPPFGGVARTLISDGPTPVWVIQDLPPRPRGTPVPPPGSARAAPAAPREPVAPGGS